MKCAVCGVRMCAMTTADHHFLSGRLKFRFQTCPEVIERGRPLPTLFRIEQRCHRLCKIDLVQGGALSVVLLPQLRELPLGVECRSFLRSCVVGHGEHLVDGGSVRQIP